MWVVVRWARVVWGGCWRFGSEPKVRTAVIPCKGGFPRHHGHFGPHSPPCHGPAPATVTAPAAATATAPAAAMATTPAAATATACSRQPPPTHPRTHVARRGAPAGAQGSRAGIGWCGRASDRPAGAEWAFGPTPSPPLSPCLTQSAPSGCAFHPCTIHSLLSLHAFILLYHIKWPGKSPSAPCPGPTRAYDAG